jgi:hypothetical protein
MARRLSPTQNVIFSAGWALMVALIFLMLARFAGLVLDSPVVFCALVLLGPTISAALCDRLSAIAFGALGLGAGLLVFCLIGAMFFVDYGDWGRVGLMIPLVSLGCLMVNISLWWCIHRLRQPSTPTTATP